METERREAMSKNSGGGKRMSFNAVMINLHEFAEFSKATATRVKSITRISGGTESHSSR
jgi:hypothetical protein